MTTAPAVPAMAAKRPISEGDGVGVEMIVQVITASAARSMISQ